MYANFLSPTYGNFFSKKSVFTKILAKTAIIFHRQKYLDLKNSIRCIHQNLINKTANDCEMVDRTPNLAMFNISRDILLNEAKKFNT